ncbi:MAG: uncharacterized protein QOD06_689 [Candidatus Binatota bacterium]|nr:uncharacterized protein [Candidatus Binatota bacterium]
MKLEIVERLGDLDAAQWDALVGDGSAFLESGWLGSLEESGCVSGRAGWTPQHLTLWEGTDLVGACPLYVKSHSMGEFVFDHAWAEAAARAGLDYYPKLLVAAPFTPAAGARLLSHPDADRPEVVRLLGAALRELCDRGGFSSVHVNFCLEDEVAALTEAGYVRRTGYQFQWSNPGWTTFEDYLAAFRSKRRVQIRRERRELDAQSIEIRAFAGDGIPDALFGTMFELYRSTIDKYFWGRQYLNLELFDRLRRVWKRRLCFIVAERHGQVVAGTFNVRKGDVLYGRYWGTFEELRYLHFNVCYYAAIELCLREGIARFEPGAGGEFKYLRGFDPRPTESMHFLADPRLARAVRDHLVRERRAVAREIDDLEEASALRRSEGGKT